MGDHELIFSYARHNRIDQVKQLLDEEGVDPEVRDWAGNTILIIACQNGLKNMIKCVLRRGAHFDTQNVSLPLPAARCTIG
jgi:ankyrin repeat protein